VSVTDHVSDILLIFGTAGYWSPLGPW